ncbi:265L [Invertebrate iridescent virus Kaz2018]|uniref:265L n=1 Tax=Invertebrate iridescent virus 6 TaxID=176652 RepID=Q91FQ8_IIV6|nr:265L [Invertebrate iridescent virus 6]AAK82126.1 265L [Invertebrate iridescent virus 6]QMS79382.1 hypothetical protein IIV6-T1_260 [Invertebrate iridescent virus 6]QNH08675.1 265L [Invertebrate iridescent virus Kaz2018]
MVPRLEDVAAGTAVDAFTDKTDPVIERPDPNVILVAAGDELFDPNNSELALNGANCPVPTTFAPSCVAPTDPAIICADPIELDAMFVCVTTPDAIEGDVAVPVKEPAN